MKPVIGTGARSGLRKVAVIVERVVSENAVTAVRRRLYPMKITTVTRVLTALTESDVPFVVAGGWGVDALAGAATRRHSDLDLIVAPAALTALTQSLSSAGFTCHGAPVRGGWWAPELTTFSDAGRNRIEVLALTDDNWTTLTAKATELLGRAPTHTRVRARLGDTEADCLSAPLQLAAHSGFAMNSKQRNDHRRLTTLQGQGPI